MSNKIIFKIDDTLISLINDYHGVEHSDIISYFGALCDNSLKCEANIINDKKRLTSSYSKKYKGMRYQTVQQASSDTYVWVLRGYYPDTKIPFKMTLFSYEQISFSSDSNKIILCKVLLGDKLKTTSIPFETIREYNEKIMEASLLEETLDGVEKIDYKLKKFKLMRPKGMPLLRKKKD